MFRRDFDQKMKILSVVNSDMFVLVVTKFRMINAPPRATWAEKYFKSLPISRVIDIYLWGDIEMETVLYWIGGEGSLIFVSVG